MDNLYRKYENISSVAKNYNFKQDTRVLLLEDHAGWSDGYLADLTKINLDNVKAQAQLKGCTNNFNKGATRPKIKKILKKHSNGAGKPVSDIEWDLNDNNIILKSKKTRTKINPTFYNYFVKAYKQFSTPTLEVTGRHSPVRVLAGGSLVGLIMPIKQH